MTTRVAFVLLFLTAMRRVRDRVRVLRKFSSIDECVCAMWDWQCSEVSGCALCWCSVIEYVRTYV